ncbi:TPA: 2-amino-4-hydroxy-6-hydroxymethyldihydropteridine diphosphokinase [Candidatus Poribacteria bacterium]|nr:2-amino-4-hydroxy-6-hydroxymethyldihydropteridine diphosphokinase [Candidatus Poribacteria bacterium]
MSLAYVSFGSNLGNRLKNIKRGLEFVSRNRSITITKKSSLYETEPVGYANQGYFLNGVVEIETYITPHRLLSILKRAERDIGRRRRRRWGPREIDFDILLYNQKCVDTPSLIVPHPRMHERGFVLIPLVEIAPKVIHPIFKKSVQQLLVKFADTKGVKFFGVLE